MDFEWIPAITKKYKSNICPVKYLNKDKKLIKCELKNMEFVENIRVGHI
jgi:hypothetical protein